MKKVTRLGAVRNIQAAATAAACIILLMVVAILRQINAAGLDLNKSLVGLPRQTYDILVRPQSASDPIEEKYGLVNPNHLNGINGGISFFQFDQIKEMKAVEVAAPVAMLGYFDQDYSQISVQDKLPFGVYRVNIVNQVNNGIENVGTQLDHPYYVLYAPSKLDISDFEAVRAVKQLGCSKGVEFRNDYSAGQHLPLQLVNPNSRMLVAAIDPEMEARLVNLDKALVVGHYLNSAIATLPPRFATSKLNTVPSLLNTRNYLDQNVLVTLSLLDVPFKKMDAVIDQLQSLPSSQELDSKAIIETHEFRYNLSGINTALYTQFSVKGDEIVSRRFYSDTLLGPDHQSSPIRFREYPEKLESWQGFTPVLEAIPEGQTSSLNFDMDKKYNVGSPFNCPGFEEWVVKPEVNYREEIKSLYTNWIDTQWVGQFEPGKIIAENASELN